MQSSERSPNFYNLFLRGRVHSCLKCLINICKRMQVSCLTWVTHFCNQFLSRSSVNEDETGDINLIQGDIDLIPDDVLFKILTLLPGDDLRKYRRVCRKWRALISARDFEELRLNHSPSVLLVQYRASKFYFLNEVELVERQFAPARVHRTMHKRFFLFYPVLFGCFNGLLLFRARYSTSPTTYSVWNPVIGEPISFTTSGQLCALFVHPSTKEYKLLLVYKTDNEDPCYTYFVCNLAVGRLAWKQIGRFGYKPKWPNVGLMRGKFLYWVIEQVHEHGISSCSKSIICFDMESEEFGAMPHPGKECREFLSKESHQNMELLEANSSLALGIICPGHIQLWILLDHANWNWLRKCVINLQSWSMNQFPFLNHEGFRSVCNWNVKLFEVHDNELLLLWQYRGLFKYNLETGGIRKIKMPKRDLWHAKDYNWCIVRYVENLASLENLSTNS